MKVEGKLHVIYEKNQVSDSFKKQEFVLAIDEDTDYPQFVKFEVVQDKIDKLRLGNKYNVNDKVEVEYNLRGREWTNKDGVVMYFNTLQCWKMDMVEEGSKTKEVVKEVEVDEDELPF